MHQIAVVVVFCLLCHGAIATNELVLKLVPNNQGAVCLDGTPPGYFWRPAQTTESTNKWIISLFGGGWCYNEEDCYQRSLTKLGSTSTKYWNSTEYGTGILNGDPKVNPDFWSFNVAQVIYCDGASFSGNKDKPITIHGQNIFFRGRRILDAVLDDLFNRGMTKATHVILTGCSAGGLSTFLHTNYVASQFSTEVVFKSIPQSGFFLLANNLNNTPVYPSEMQYVYNMQNCSFGVDANCTENLSPSDQWKCISGPAVYPYIQVPVFVLNSFYDEWQMENILGAEINTFQSCATQGPETCTSNQIRQANKFHHNFLELIEGSPTFSSPQNGVFLHSCWTHCASTRDQHWINYRIRGVSMRHAVGDWFFERTTNNTHIDCTLKTQSPYRCNPSCPS